jgi:large subunit ribosomal protein L18
MSLKARDGSPALERKYRMASGTEKWDSRKKRTRRVRFKVGHNQERPRLTVFRSNKNIFAQIVDDRQGLTLVQASTLDKEFRKKPGDPFNMDTAREVGKRIAARAKERNIGKVVFDRGPYLYHGKVKALADGARDGGLDF